MKLRFWRKSPCLHVWTGDPSGHWRCSFCGYLSGHVSETTAFEMPDGSWSPGRPL